MPGIIEAGMSLPPFPEAASHWAFMILLLRSGAYKDSTGMTRLPILAIRAPKNGAREQALGMASVSRLWG